MPRRFDLRRVKIHRSYPVAELAALIGAHKQTIGRWIAAGLPKTGGRRSTLIHGADVRAFSAARKPMKQKCKPGEFFCLGCRAPRRPALDMAEYRPRSPLRGSLCGFCPVCDRLIYRAVTRAKIEQIAGGLNIMFPKAE
jgi:hypothetical protein